MTVANIAKTNWTGGRFSDLMLARTDFDKTPNAAEVIENALVLPQGGAQRRGGMIMAGESNDHSKKSILLPFRFNKVQAYQIEFGDQHLRFYKDNGQIFTTPGADLVTNGAFAANIASWTDNSTGTGAIVWDGAGAMTLTGVDSDNVAAAEQSLTVVVGETYEVVFDVIDNPLTAKVGATTTAGDEKLPQSFAVGASNVFYFIATTTTSFIQFYNALGTAAKLDNVVCKKVDPLEVTTNVPWLEADLYELQIVQSGNVLYVFHEDYQPHKITRSSHTAWTSTPFLFTNAPSNLTAAANLILNGTFDEDLTSWADKSTTTGTSSHDGSGALELQSDGTGFGITEQNITVVTAKIHELVLLFDEHTGSDKEIVVRCGTATGLSDLLADTVWTPGKRSISFTSSGTACFLQIENNNSGTAKIDDVVIRQTQDATIDANTYPGVCGFKGPRLMVGRTKDNPQSFWVSQQNQFENMNFGTALDTDAFSQTLADGDVDNIEFLISMKKNIFIGTTSTEFAITGNGAAITPTNIDGEPQTNWGAASMMAVKADRAVLFFQDGGLILREIAPDPDSLSDEFVAEDLTLLSHDITETGVIQMAFQKRPNSVLWCVTTDGRLLGFTYLRKQKITAWHEHPTTGTVESVSVIPNLDGTQDEVWVKVARTIDGSTKRYTEYVDSRKDVDSSGDILAVGCDSCLEYSGLATNIFPGLQHLKNTKVVAVVNGAVFEGDGTGLTVDANGKLTLPDGETGTKAYIGLRYDTTLTTPPVDVMLASGGSTGGRKRKWMDTLVRLKNTGALEVNGEDVQIRKDSDAPDVATPLFTGWKKAGNVGWGREGQITFKMTKSLPFTCLGFVGEVDINDT